MLFKSASSLTSFVYSLDTPYIRCHGAMGHRIDPSWGGPISDTSRSSRSSQCSTTGVTKVVVCAILSVGWCILKNPCC